MGRGFGCAGMSVTYQKERFIDIMAELPPLFVAHDHEVHTEKEALPLNPHWAGYLTSEQRGSLHIVTARDNGKLVGYVFLFVNLSFQISRLIAITDLIYLAPEYRRGFEGVKMLKKAKEMARSLDAVKLYLIAHGSEGLERVFSRLGASKAETVYAMLL